jgi:hypothetical protein
MATVSGNRDQSNVDYTKLRQTLGSASDDAALYVAAVNAPFEQKVEMAYLFLGIIMVALVDPETNCLLPKAISQTDFVKEIDDMAVIPFDKISIHLDNTENLLVQAITSGQPKTTTDWTSLLNPVMESSQARFTQASGGIAYTAVYPLNGVRAGGALVYSFFERSDKNIAAQNDFMDKYTALVIDVFKSKQS